MPEINRGVKGHPVSTLGEGCPRTTVKPECKLTAEKILALWRGGDSRCFQGGKLFMAPSRRLFQLVVIRHVHAQAARRSHLRISRNQLLVIVIDRKIERVRGSYVHQFQIRVAHGQLSKTDRTAFELQIITRPTTFRDSRS